MSTAPQGNPREDQGADDREMPKVGQNHAKMMINYLRMSKNLWETQDRTYRPAQYQPSNLRFFTVSTLEVTGPD